MRYSELLEAPIDNYELVGNWGDQEKANSFHDPKDRRAVQSPKLQAHARKMFGNTDHVLNFFFINAPGMRKFSEHGFMEKTDVAKNFPLVVERIEEKGIDTSESINVIFVSNSGANKVPMTPWIMAHRIGHAIQADIRGFIRRTGAWHDYEIELYDYIKRILSDYYNYDLDRTKFVSDKSLAKFYEAIGTMKSAVNNNLGGRPYEFVYELFAQYITTGDIKFRTMPMSFGIRGNKYSFKPDPDDNDSVQKQLEYTSEMNLDRGLAWMLPDRIENVLYDCEGKFLVM